MLDYSVNFNGTVFEFTNEKTRQLYSSLTILKSHHDFAMQLFKDAVINDPEYANDMQGLNDDGWQKFIDDCKKEEIKFTNFQAKRNQSYKTVSCFDVIINEIPPDEFDKEKNSRNSMSTFLMNFLKKMKLFAII